MQWVSWDPANITKIVASGAGRTVTTQDGGATWTEISPPKGTAIVELDPKDSQLLYAGIHDGERVTVKVSRDGGGTWQNP